MLDHDDWRRHFLFLVVAASQRFLMPPDVQPGDTRHGSMSGHSGTVLTLEPLIGEESTPCAESASLHGNASPEDSLDLLMSKSRPKLFFRLWTGSGIAMLMFSAWIMFVAISSPWFFDGTGKELTPSTAFWAVFKQEKPLFWVGAVFCYSW